MKKIIKLLDKNGNELVPDTINKLQTYSTEEKVIGTWIDGKPLYRKTITVVISGAITGTVQNFQFNHNISNIKYAWVEVATHDISQNGFSYGPSGYINAANNRTQWYMSNEIIAASCDRSGDDGTWYISICYTKTTD